MMQEEQTTRCSTRSALALTMLLGLVPSLCGAHHGVASLGVAGLEGPGAPIEASSSATLPEGSVLTYLKLDYASFERYTAARDDEGAYSAFWIYGLGYGATPYLSLYLFAPFNIKTVEDNSFNTSGFADISLMVTCAFSWDGGLGLVPPNESLDDLEDWHFTIYGGGTLPTGDANLRNAGGEIDPGMSLGFGRSSYALGATASKQFASRATLVLDASTIGFRQYRYDDGNQVKFGTEYRLNTALPVRLMTRAESRLRLDAGLEVNYLALGRDELNGNGEAATGGKIVYLVPGLRLYYQRMSVGLGIKTPAWTELNEEPDQQGAEGKESYRTILTFSALF